MLAGCGTTAQRDATTPPAPVSTVSPASNDARTSESTIAPKEPGVGLQENQVFFAFGEATLNEKGKATLDAHIERLKENPLLQVILTGHTDNLGSRAYNLAIAERRLDSVADYLREQGVRRGQIRRVAVGHEKTIRNCKDAACRHYSRRVELSFRESKR